MIYLYTPLRPKSQIKTKQRRLAFSAFIHLVYWNGRVLSCLLVIMRRLASSQHCRRRPELNL